MLSISQYNEMSIVPQNIGKIYDAGLDRAFEAVEIHALAEEQAHKLWELGVGPESRVLISHGNSIGFYVDLFACWLLGACAVPIDPTTSVAELDRIGKFIETPLLLHREAPADRLGALSFRSFHRDELLSPRKSREVFLSEIQKRSSNLDGDAVILFTSGSTSEPKGVVHTFRTVLAKMAIYRRSMPKTEWERTLCIIPTHFVYGLMSNSLGPLFQGCDLYVYPSFNLEILTGLSAILERHKITAFCSVPSMWRIVIDFSEKTASSSLKRIHCAAAPLSRDLWLQIREWSNQVEVKNVYGATEMACAVTGPKDGQDFHDGFVGQGWDTKVVVMDDQMRPLGVAEIGEVYLQGPSMMKGYFRRPDATAEVIRNGWYRTGDLGKTDANGDVTLVGRSTYVINKAGMKIYPEDVESLIGSHPDVMDICVFGVPDTLAGQVVGAAVVLSRNSAGLPALENWCRENLTSFKVPTKWFSVTELPRTSRGKINRLKLAETLTNKKTG